MGKFKERIEQLAADIIKQRIKNLEIYITLETALKLKSNGVNTDPVFNLYARGGFSGTCIYHPFHNKLSCSNGMYTMTQDEIALEVALLPTDESKMAYLKDIDYRSPDGTNYFTSL